MPCLPAAQRRCAGMTDKLLNQADLSGPGGRHPCMRPRCARPAARTVSLLVASLLGCTQPAPPALMPMAADSEDAAPLVRVVTSRPADASELAPPPERADESLLIRLGEQRLLALRSAAITVDDTLIPCRISARATTTQPGDRASTIIDLVPDRAGYAPLRCELLQDPSEVSFAVVSPRSPPRLELIIETLLPMLPVCLEPREPDRIIHAAVGPVAGGWFDGLFEPRQDFALRLAGPIYCEELPDRVRLTLVLGEGYPAPNDNIATLAYERDFLKIHHNLTGYAPVDHRRLEPMPAAWMPLDAGESANADEITRNTIWMAVNLKPYGAASVLLPQLRSAAPGIGAAASAPVGRTRRPSSAVAAWESLQRSGMDIAGAFWGHGIIAGSSSSSLTVGRALGIEQARLYASLLGMAGYSPIAGEQMYQLGEERVELLRRIIPAAPVRTVDLFAHRGFPPVWNLALATDAGRWNILGLFNTSDESRLESIELEDLHLGTGTEQFAVFDVWEKRLLRLVTDRFQIHVPATGCRVLSITRIHDDRPTVLGTSRHLTAGGPDLHHVHWDTDTLTLSGQSEVVAHDPYELRLHVPKGDRAWEVMQVRSAADRTHLRGYDALRVITFEAQLTGLLDWQISFYRAGSSPEIALTQPRNLLTRQTTRGVHIEWYAPDERAVAYRVYRNQRLIGEAESCEYQDSTAAYSASFQYTVTAVDAHGAESVPSDSVTHQTPTPASTNLTQLVPLSVSQERLSVGQDRGATGGPLRVANQRIYRGLGVAVPSRVVYFLGGGYDAFSGVVGIDDAADARASAIFRVVADGQTLFTSPVMHAGQAAISFTARVRGKTRLELLTTDAEDGSDSDYGVWGNPYLRAAAPE